VIRHSFTGSGIIGISFSATVCKMDPDDNLESALPTCSAFAINNTITHVVGRQPATTLVQWEPLLLATRI